MSNEAKERARTAANLLKHAIWALSLEKVEPVLTKVLVEFAKEEVRKTTGKNSKWAKMWYGEGNIRGRGKALDEAVKVAREHDKSHPRHKDCETDCAELIAQAIEKLKQNEP